VRDDLVNTLERIMQNRSKFDYILVETTGMANPGPIASIFWLDDELGRSVSHPLTYHACTITHQSRVLST